MYLLIRGNRSTGEPRAEIELRKVPSSSTTQLPKIIISSNEIITVLSYSYMHTSLWKCSHITLNSTMYTGLGSQSNQLIQLHYGMSSSGHFLLLACQAMSLCHQYQLDLCCCHTWGFTVTQLLMLECITFIPCCWKHQDQRCILKKASGSVSLHPGASSSYTSGEVCSLWWNQRGHQSLSLPSKCME